MNWIWAFLAGAAASFINTFAGGGSLITLPFLLFLGLPAPVANGTNKIGLIAGTFSASANFTRKKVIHWKEVLIIAPSGLVGGIIGSLFSIEIQEDLYRKLLSGVMIMVLIMILIRPQRFLHHMDKLPHWLNRLFLVLFFLGVGFYGGFIQAGMGYLVIIGMSLFGDVELKKISAYKAVIGFVIVFFSALVFIISGKINWPVALALALGNAAGAWLGSSLAIEKGDKVIRPILVVVVVAMALKLSGILELLFPGLSL